MQIINLRRDRRTAAIKRILYTAKHDYAVIYAVGNLFMKLNLKIMWS